MPIREIAQNFHNFCQKYIPPLSEFSHCFCPNFGKKQWRIRAKAMGNSGKSNLRKFGQKQWENPASGGILYFGQKLLLLPEFPIAFSLICHCFCPNLPLLLPEFPTAFARIFRFQNFLLLSIMYWTPRGRVWESPSSPNILIRKTWTTGT